MGRKIPLSNSDPSQTFHQTLGVPVLLAGIAAVLAVVSLLCGVRLRRKSKSYQPADKNTNSPLISQPAAIETSQQQQQQESVAEPGLDIESQINLQTAKKTPGKQIMRDKFSSRNLMKKSASTRVLAKNWSTKMQRSMSMAGRELQERMNKGGKMKAEESVWMKTIILGERCRVEEGEDAVIYEAKGNRISAYHPKTSNSLFDLYAYRSNVADNREPRGFSE